MSFVLFMICNSIAA